MQPICFVSLVALIILLDLVIRLIPSKRPASLAHLAGHALLRVGHHGDRILPQRLK